MLKSDVLREVYAAFVCYHAGILYGLDLAFTSYFVESPDGFNVLQEGLLGSFSILFRGLGAFVSACLVDRLGRKTTLFTAFATSGMAWLTIFIFSSTFELLLIGRILSGISIALSYASNVCYVAEISNKKRRGMLVALRAVVISFGMNVVTITASIYHWKWIGAIGLVVCVSGSLQLIYVPETKYWLILKGRRPEALKSAMWFSPSESINQIETELTEIENSLSRNTDQKTGICTIFSRKSSLKALLVSCSLVILIAGTGRAAIVTHIEHFIISFQHTFDSQKLVVLLNATEFFVCILYAIVVDKFDRKSVMYFTLYVMSFSLIGILFYDLEVSRFVCVSAPMIPVFLLFTYLLITVTGLLACTVVVLSEIVGNENKGSILNISNGISCLTSAGYSTALPYALKYVDVHYTILFFLTHVVLLMMFVHFILPETRGKPLHECGFQEKRKKVYAPRKAQRELK